MRLSYSNDIRIYNLSAGKSIPEWISDRKRRKLEQKDIDIRRRIQLIQDFEMPDVSHIVNVSPDGRYVFAAGTYKPVVKCFDLNEISLKFSRGLDADVVKLIVLSDDYSKFVLLEEDRYLEMHAAFGRYFRLRIPRFGRDMAFCREASDLMIVGSSNEIYRLNLEQGRFLESFVSSSSSLTCCDLNDQHQLFLCGTIDGRVEAWDHRDRKQASVLNCAADSAANDQNIMQLPQISTIRFKDALHIAVGSSLGNILLYDIRSNRPLLVKDHQLGLPIRRVEFVPDHELILSMDSRVLKIWYEENGKPFAAIEPGTSLTDLCRYPGSGLIFMTNESPKILQYFVPAIGTAPKWCSYLETITEELEETEQPAVYDDYKFVTARELEDLDLDVDVLKRMSMVRAYMHGYFIDAKLYNKSRAVKQQFDLQKYREKKLMERVETERSNPISLKKLKEEKLPKVNKELALKLRKELSLSKENIDKKWKKKGKEATEILSDKRFERLFTNPDFQVDEKSEHYQLTQQALQKMKEKSNRLKKKNSGSESSDSGTEDFPQSSLFMTDDNVEDEESENEEESAEDENEEESTDEEPTTSKIEQLDEDEIDEKDYEMKLERGKVSPAKIKGSRKPTSFELIELVSGEDAAQFTKLKSSSETADVKTLGALRGQMENDNTHISSTNSFGNRQMSFVLKARNTAARRGKDAEKQAQHLKERREARRDARQITRTLKKLPIKRGFYSHRRGRR